MASGKNTDYPEHTIRNGRRPMTRRPLNHAVIVLCCTAAALLGPNAAGAGDLKLMPTPKSVKLSLIHI